MRVLLTYFEPFNGKNINVSKEIISSINIDNFECETKELKVTYSNFETIKNDLTNKKYDFIFLFGEAPYKEDITFEIFAKNLMNSKIKDNDGVIKTNELIDINVAKLEGITTTFNVNNIKKICNKYRDSYSLNVSKNAGGYICNSTYFNFLNYYKDSIKPKVIFIHLKSKITDYSRIQKQLITIINELITFEEQKNTKIINN